MYKRSLITKINKYLQKDTNLFHIITGPRQVGKTTAAQQIIEQWKGPHVYAAADIPLPPGPEWIQAQWELAKTKAKNSAKNVLLVLDEVQKVHGWSETIKGLWDEKQIKKLPLSMIILGSSAMLLQKGTSESLTGRFFIHRFQHWSYMEMRDAFGWTLDQWIFYGGYPGSVPFIDDHQTWCEYIGDSLIEPVLSRDVLQMQTVAKPALLRHLFGLAVSYPAQIFSYNKMLGQLQDAGNTTTLAQYLRLLETAYLISGLESFKKGVKKFRASSPKMIIWNNALITAIRGTSFDKLRNDTIFWGRLVENAVGASLLNFHTNISRNLQYWRKKDKEVDFVISLPEHIWGIEVKSGKQATTRGLRSFLKEYAEAKPFIIGHGGMDLEEFFLTDPKELF